MAEIRVERRNAVPWWVWLIGVLLLVAGLWSWLGREDRDRAAQTSNATAAVTPASPVANAPTEALNPASAPGTAMDPAVSNAAVTDPGFYAATVDKASLYGREAALDGVKVVRIVGPKTFTVASGSDELFVIIDQDLERGVGSQGRIDIGDSVTLKGSFQRLRQETVNDISDRRFRALTEAERATLGKTQVYLHATEVDRRG